MGCCVSTPSPTPYGGPDEASSRIPIIAIQPERQVVPHPHSLRDGPLEQAQTAGQDPSIIAKPNKQLRPLRWSSTDRTWTRQQIDQERDDFFFTRVTGRPEVWQTIRTALEVMWHGGDESDDDGGLKTAQMILNAASITLPHSTLDKGVYDVSGAFYALPKYIIADPTNLIVDAIDSPNHVEDAKSAHLLEDGRESDAPDQANDQAHTESEGSLETIQLKARRSDGGGGDLVITAGRMDTVRQIRRKFHDASEISSPKEIQIWYMGRRLNEELPLDKQGWRDGDMLQAFVQG